MIKEKVEVILNNEKTYRCACDNPGRRHVFTTDASGNHVLMVDTPNAHLLRDVSWTVNRINGRKEHLEARAIGAAPGVKKKASLHRIVTKAQGKGQRVVSRNGNRLDSRRSNLEITTAAGVRARSMKHERKSGFIGVRKGKMPKWLKSNKPYSAAMSIGRKTHLASFESAALAACCYDGAAVAMHGRIAVTNKSLRLLPADVASSAEGKRAAAIGRKKVEQHREEVELERLRAPLRGTWEYRMDGARY